MSIGTTAALISAAIAAGGSVGAAALAAHGASSASDEQAQAAQAALDFAKQKQSEQLAQEQPYLALGQQAVAQLPNMVRPMPNYAMPTPYGYPQQPTSLSGMNQPLVRGPVQTTQPVAPPVMQGGAPSQAAQLNQQTVRLQAPDGSQRDVPVQQAQFYISKGAKRV